jgi:hypothetical protein
MYSIGVLKRGLTQIYADYNKLFNFIYRFFGSYYAIKIFDVSRIINYNYTTIGAILFNSQFSKEEQENNALSVINSLHKNRVKRKHLFSACKTPVFCMQKAGVLHAKHRCFTDPPLEALLMGGERENLNSYIS